MPDPLFLDVVRNAHLLCVVLGMGPALYYDLRSLHRIGQPSTQMDVDELHRIHTVVTAACIGLWLSGATLIWIRTSFDISSFSPKLWSKIIVVTILTLNSLVLNIFVIPTLARNVGSRLIDLRARTLTIMTLCAGISLSCWLLALALGASSILKVAQWDVLTPILLGTSVLCISGVFTLTFGIRRLLRKEATVTV